MKCKNCKKKEANKYSLYSSGEFCSKVCARSFSTKENRDSRNRKISESLSKITPKIKKECKHCDKKFSVRPGKASQKFCSRDCARKGHEFTKEGLEKVKRTAKKYASTPEGRKRMRDIGMSSGFGKRGHTDKGTYFMSSIEEKCFSFLEENGISFEPHKYVPNSSKVSDVYFEKFELWYEIDGMSREKRKDIIPREYKYWVEKINIYEEQGLEYIVVKNFEEFRTSLIERGIYKK